MSSEEEDQSQLNIDDFEVMIAQKKDKAELLRAAPRVIYNTTDWTGEKFNFLITLSETHPFIYRYFLSKLGNLTESDVGEKICQKGRKESVRLLFHQQNFESDVKPKDLRTLVNSCMANSDTGVYEMIKSQYFYKSHVENRKNLETIIVSELKEKSQEEFQRRFALYLHFAQGITPSSKALATLLQSETFKNDLLHSVISRRHSNDANIVYILDTYPRIKAKTKVIDSILRNISHSSTPEAEIRLLHRFYNSITDCPDISKYTLQSARPMRRTMRHTVATKKAPGILIRAFSIRRKLSILYVRTYAPSATVAGISRTILREVSMY